MLQQVFRVSVLRGRGRGRGWGRSQRPGAGQQQPLSLQPADPQGVLLPQEETCRPGIQGHRIHSEGILADQIPMA